MRSPFRGACAIAAVIAIAVSTLGCVSGKGPVISEQREVRAFSRIEVGAGIDVVFRVGPVGTLEIRAQENILKAVATDVIAETLTIEASDDFVSAEPVTVTVTAPALDAVSLSGGASADVGGLAAETLDVIVKGGSRATLAGSASLVNLTADGGSEASLDDLAATDVVVTLAGGAKATVRATGTVKGVASGGAALTVAGGADLGVDASGGAQVAAR